MDIKQIKQTLNLTNANLADMFGYKTADAYMNSSAKPRLEKGIVKLYKKIKEQPEKK